VSDEFIVPVCRGHHASYIGQVMKPHGGAGCRLAVGGIAIRRSVSLLAISGEQGSAKTVLSKLLKALIDPNAAPVRALSREQCQLMIAADNGFLLAFDDPSGLSHWLSDALCRLVSRSSFAVRQLYTDDKEVLFGATRPTPANGIEESGQPAGSGRPRDLSDLGAHWRATDTCDHSSTSAAVWALSASLSDKGKIHGRPHQDAFEAIELLGF
jgi:hypothetical protein